MTITNEEKRKLQKSFVNWNKDVETPTARSLNSDILIIDGLNTFFRAFMANPTLNENGIHVGGIAGFLQSVGYAIKLLKPTRVIVVFDGDGGSKARRELYPEYKNKRKTNFKFNRAYDELVSIDQEEKNVQAQLMRLIAYLDSLPIFVMSLNQVEADDTIAYLSRESFKDSNKIYIMSSDKDFLQIVNDRVTVWSPTKKKIYGCAEILLEYGISCENFINYRVLTGDKSDNIDGILGSGLKTIHKCFPLFKDAKQYSLEEIYAYCVSNQSRYKLYSTILKNKPIVERNFKLMQLQTTQLQPVTQLKINDILSKNIPPMNRIKFNSLINEDKMWNTISNPMVWVNETFSMLANTR
jgi:5'-3' exonuclease